MSWFIWLGAAVAGACGLLFSKTGKVWLAARSQATKDNATLEKDLAQQDQVKDAKLKEVKTAGDLVAEKEREAHEARARAIEADAEKARAHLAANPDELPAGLVDSLARATTKRGGGDGGSGTT